MRPAAAQIKRWREDPVLFVRECLKAEPDEWQVEVLRAYVTNQRVALKASKGPGKTTVEAWIGLHFVSCFPHPKVVATSISGDNLRDGLWTEFAKWMQKSPFLTQAFEWSAERIVARGHEKTWWISARQWSKTADPGQQANTLAGIHADYVLFLLDEVGGIPEGVVAAAEAGLATGKHTRMVIAGNPTHTSGPLYRACTRERHLWWVKEISGDPDDPKRAPKVSIQWAREQIEKYGRDHPYVLVNVLGKFPPAQSNTLVGVEAATAAAKRYLHESEWNRDARVMGVDVARFGDDRSVIQYRQGRMAFEPKTFRNLDTMELVGQVAMAIEKWKPHATFIDVGGVGAGVVDRLKQLGHEVTGIEFGGKAYTSEPKLANHRTEMWWKMAQWIAAGGCIPDDAELISELSAPTYSFNDANAIRLERKEELKKRGLPSPDKADALALTFALPVMVPAVREALMLQGTAIPGVNRTQDYDPYSERSF